MSDDFSLDELLNRSYYAFKEAENQVGQCNVLVIGKTGVGKSTLINSVFRQRLAETGVAAPSLKAFANIPNRIAQLQSTILPDSNLTPNK